MDHFEVQLPNDFHRCYLVAPPDFRSLNKGEPIRGTFVCLSASQSVCLEI